MKAILNNSKVLNLVPENDEPVSVSIIRAGWMDEYHVITEYGDSGESTCKRLTSLQIKQQYNVNINNFIPTI